VNLTVYSDLEQRSPEWYAARCGIVTASVVGQLLTYEPPNSLEVACPECGVDALSPCVSLARRKTEAPKALKKPHAGRVSTASAKPPVLAVATGDTFRTVTAALVAERVNGWTEDTYMNADMWRGVEHEPIARDKYAEVKGVEVTEVGFMVLERDGWRLGYSPDGLVGDDGLIEVKCPRAKSHLSTIVSGEVPAYYMAQLQAGLLVSGCEWIDYVSFCAGMPLFIKRVTADEKWHAAIAEAVAAFEKAAEQMASDYLTAAVGLPETERIENNDLGLVF
jgi:hypothetical protein